MTFYDTLSQWHRQMASEDALPDGSVFKQLNGPLERREPTMIAKNASDLLNETYLPISKVYINTYQSLFRMLYEFAMMFLTDKHVTTVFLVFDMDPAIECRLHEDVVKTPCFPGMIGEQAWKTYLERQPKSERMLGSDGNIEEHTALPKDLRQLCANRDFERFVISEMCKNAASKLLSRDPTEVPEISSNQRIVVLAHGTNSFEFTRADGIRRDIGKEFAVPRREADLFFGYLAHRFCNENIDVFTDNPFAFIPLACGLGYRLNARMSAFVNHVRLIVGNEIVVDMNDWHTLESHISWRKFNTPFNFLFAWTVAVCIIVADSDRTSLEERNGRKLFPIDPFPNARLDVALCEMDEKIACGLLTAHARNELLHSVAISRGLMVQHAKSFCAVGETEVKRKADQLEWYMKYAISVVSGERGELPPGGLFSLQ